MKPILAPILVCLVSIAFAVPAGAAPAENPKAVLESIAKIRADRAAEAKESGKKVDTAALNKELTERAQAALAGVKVEQIDLAEAKLWLRVYTQAQDHRGGVTLAKRWVAESQGTNKFDAQMALATAQSQAGDFAGMTGTLMTAEPADTAQRITLASVANGYLYNVVKNEGPEAGLKLLKAVEMRLPLPTENFTDERQKGFAQRTRERVEKSRKTIEENPGKEAPELLQLLRAASQTASTEAAAASRAERDAKLEKMVGKQGADFKAEPVIGKFKSVADLKGKVVMLDFFTHWCGPCIASFPSVREMYDELKPQGLEVVGVTRFQGFYKTENRTTRDMKPETELEKMKEFVTEKKMNWPVVFVDKTAWDAYECSAIPHVVLLDRTGKIHKVKVGFSASTFASFRAEVEKLLKQ